MKVHVACALLAFAWGLLFAEQILREANVLGYQPQNLPRGLSRIQVDLDPICLFPTLEKVVQFFPPEGIVGDRIEFDLDGVHQIYSVVTYEGGRYRLRSSQKKVPQEITFNGIPFLGSFEMRHVSTNEVLVTMVGEAFVASGDEVRRKTCVPKDGSEFTS